MCDYNSIPVEVILHIASFDYDVWNTLRKADDRLAAYLAQHPVLAQNVLSQWYKKVDIVENGRVVGWRTVNREGIFDGDYVLFGMRSTMFGCRLNIIFGPTNYRTEGRYENGKLALKKVIRLKEEPYDYETCIFRDGKLFQRISRTSYDHIYRIYNFNKNGECISHIENYDGKFIMKKYEIPLPADHCASY